MSDYMEAAAITAVINHMLSNDGDADIGDIVNVGVGIDVDIGADVIFFLNDTCFLSKRKTKSMKNKNG